MKHTTQPQQQPTQEPNLAQASSKANELGAKRENCINSETAAIYHIAKNDTTQRADEDRLISDALAILDGRIKRGESLTDPKQAANYCKVRLQRLEHEVFLVLFLDTRHRVIASEEMFRGTIDSSQIHPREVAKRALELNASAVIFAHNHPSGDSKPSSADCTVTDSLKKALALLEIRVLDHFVVGDGVPVSFAEKGWI